MGATPVFETERLILRTMDAGDLNALHGVLSDPEATRYFDACRPLMRSEVGDKLAEWIEHGEAHGFMPGLMVLKETSEIAGHGGLGYYPETEAEGPELVYVLKRPYWGMGLATEFARESLAFGFDSLKVSRILSTVRPESEASIHVLGKVGMRRRSFLPEENRFLYAIDVGDWRS
ncbi:MAG: GNAT family N-acetyltransferase [Candidatus Latescibacteria bacterium]|jgi:ribosomal-protein-alanine N-acetyltransferase|nr:GNAT family N-acetyltransferase [Candidatus Latescibacterota bacterium]